MNESVNKISCLVMKFWAGHPRPFDDQELEIYPSVESSDIFH